jgi:hypothetical protein
VWPCHLYEKGYIKAKEKNYAKLKYFTMQKNNLSKILYLKETKILLQDIIIITLL